MRKVFLIMMSAFAVGIGAAQAAELATKVGPPKNRSEHRSARPSKDQKLPGAPLKVSDSRYPIDYATAAPFAIGFLDPPMLAIEEMNMGISRWPITLRN